MKRNLLLVKKISQAATRETIVRQGIPALDVELAAGARVDVDSKKRLPLI